MKILSLSEIHSENGQNDFSFYVDKTMPADVFELSKDRFPPGVELTLEGEVLRCKIVDRPAVQLDQLVRQLNEAFEVTQASLDEERKRKANLREIELKTLAQQLGVPLEDEPKF